MSTQRQRHRTFDSITVSSRPALQKLTRDIQDDRDRLLGGFVSTREILEWAQSMTVRTLGQMPDRVYEKLAHAYRRPYGEGQSPMIAALLDDEYRDRDMSESAARELRERLYDVYLHPAYHDAFRQLRKDASEYNEETWGSGSDDHTAELQRFTAMRPAVDELREYQEQALAGCLDGLSSRDALVDWCDVVELATHGEIDSAFETRVRTESVVDVLLVGDESEDQHARELFAAYWLLPAFNAGVRDLSGRAGEQVKPDRDDDSELPRWD